MGPIAPGKKPPQFEEEKSEAVSSRFATIMSFLIEKGQCIRLSDLLRQKSSISLLDLFTHYICLTKCNLCCTSRFIESEIVRDNHQADVASWARQCLKRRDGVIGKIDVTSA